MPDLPPPSKDPASFAQPQGRPLEQPPVPEMTPEQADALLKDLAVPGEPDQPTAEGLPVPELEPEPEAPAEAAPGEGEPPAPEPASLTEKLDEVISRLEESNLRREKLELEIAHERRLRDEAASRAGYYKKTALDMAGDLARRVPAAAPEAGEPAGDEAQVAPIVQAVVAREMQRFEGEITRMREEASRRGINDELGRFFEANPDAENLMEEMMSAVAQQRANYADFLASGDPRITSQTVNVILETAYREARARKLQADRAAAVDRRAVATRGADAAKARAAPAATGASPAPKPRPRTIEDLDADTAGKLLEKMARESLR